MALLSGLLGAKEPERGAGDLAGGDLVKNSDTKGFMTDVIEASKDVPIIVDFWAPWCGPCKQLGPVLEKAVRAAGGKVRLVKVNIDENQALAQQLRIQSIPMVYAFKDGQPADGFAGALPESQINEFIERIAGPVAPDTTDMGLEQAKQAAMAGDLAMAAQIYEQLMAEDAANPEVIAGLARCHIGLGRPASARALLDQTPKDHAHHVEIDGAKAALSLAEEAGTLEDPADLAKRLEANSGDHAARLDLATALFLRNQIEPAIDHLMTIIQADKEWQDHAARKQLITFFDALGSTHPATVAGRRRLSTVLFS